MINILKCTKLDLNTLIEINNNKINTYNTGSLPPFIIGAILDLKKENKQLKQLINY
jgi:hypothetical protein